MSKQLPLSVPDFAVPLQLSKDVGKKGELRWIDLDQLYIDPTYQRQVLEQGKRNIRKIAENFNWAYFSPLKVAPRGPNQYAIIDGQHHAIAALARGDIKRVPCMVDDSSYEVQARAFAMINGSITKISPMALHRADVAAGDGRAKLINTACARAGVTILGYPKQDCAVGETMAVGRIKFCFERYGADILVLALELVTKTADGNAGMLREWIIGGGCRVFLDNPNWRAGARAVVERLTIKALAAKALKQQGAQGQGSMGQHFADVLATALKAELGDGGKPALPAKVEKAKKSPPPCLSGSNLGPLRPTEARRAPMPVAKPKAQVSQDERALIEAHLKTKGVRRFDTADTGDDFQLCEWLKRKGFEVQRYPGKSSGPYAFKIDRKNYSRAGFIAFVNKHRAKEKLPPIGALND